MQALYEQHGRVMLAYAIGLVRDRAVAEDLVHQVFLRLLRGGIDITDSPLAYLCRAVRNAALNHQRQRHREIDLAAVEHWLESPPGQEEVGRSLERAVAELPPEQRDVVVLRIWGDMTFDEIATVLEMSPNTAASRYRYGLLKLKAALSPVARS